MLILNHFRYIHIAFHKLAHKYRTKILGVYLGSSYKTTVVNDYENFGQVLTRPELQGKGKRKA
jgi:hypothetical protein